MKTSRTTTSGRGLKPTLIVAGFIACLLFWASTELILAVQTHANDARYEDSWGPVRMKPSLLRCPTAQSKWDCIRHANYRRTQ